MSAVTTHPTNRCHAEGGTLPLRQPRPRHLRVAGGHGRRRAHPGPEPVRAGLGRPQQFLVSWLFAFMFFFTISAGSLFWILIHYTMDAEWSAVIKRLLETAANSFSVLPFFFIPMAVGAPILYKWMRSRPASSPPWTTSTSCSTHVVGGVHGDLLQLFLQRDVHPALALAQAGQQQRHGLLDQGAGCRSRRSRSSACC